MIVDDTQAVLPEIARDQHWDELDVQLPYTLATQHRRRDAYTATADNIESVQCQRKPTWHTLPSIRGARSRGGEGKCPSIFERRREIVREHRVKYYSRNYFYFRSTVGYW